MITNYLSTIDVPIFGFQFVEKVSNEIINDTLFAIVVEDLPTFRQQFLTEITTSAGIFITIEDNFSWSQLSPCVWHFTLPQGQLDNIMPLIQGQLSAILQQHESQNQLKTQFEKRANRTANALTDLIKFIALQFEQGTIGKLRFRVLEFLLDSDSFSYSSAALMRYSKRRKRWSVVSKKGDWSHKEKLTDVPILTDQVVLEGKEWYVQQVIKNEDYVLVVTKNFDDDYTEIEMKFFHLFALIMKVTFETKILQENNNLELIRRKEAQQALSRAVQTRDEFLASMSHELRTPLNAILGQSQLLAMNVYGPLTAKQVSSVQGIKDSGNHLLSLINDILDLSKLEAVEVNLNISTFNITDLATACLAFVQELASRKQIEISPPQTSTMQMAGDERRVKQILINLLSNAVKFTPINGQIGLDIESSVENNMVSISVWDTGIGIKQNDLSKLFQPFVQVDSKLNRKYEGSGLGLVLVDRLTRLHGGTVSVTSKPEFGSRFTVELPLKPSTPSPSSKEVPQSLVEELK